MLRVVQTDIGVVLHAERLPDLLLHVFRIAPPGSPLNQDSEDSRGHAAVIVAVARFLLEPEISYLLLLIDPIVQTGHRSKRVRRVCLLEFQAGTHIQQMLHSQLTEHRVGIPQLRDVIRHRVVHALDVTFPDCHSAQHGRQRLGY